MEHITNTLLIGMDNRTGFNADEINKGMEKFALSKLQWLEGGIPLKSIPQYALNGIVVVMCLSLVIGSYFKSLYYGRILEIGLSIKEHAINVMLLCGSIIQHTKQVLGTMFYVVVIFSDGKLGQMFGTVGCDIAHLIATFAFEQLVIGDLMTAIFRLMYIKCNNWMKYRAGIVTVFVVLFGGGLLMSIGITILFHANLSNGRGKILYNACMGHSEAFADILQQYKNPMGR